MHLTNYLQLSDLSYLEFVWAYPKIGLWSFSTGSIVEGPIDKRLHAPKNYVTSIN